MSPKRIQLFFVLGVSCMALHFTVMFGFEMANFLRLKNRANAQITQWEIVSVKDRFALKAEYEFNAQEKSCQSSFTLNPPYFLNEMAALGALKELAKNDWGVWYHPKTPQQSALQKSFPTGLLFRTLICYGVLIYFFYLTKKVVRL